MKHCDCIVLNDTAAISSLENHVEVLSPEATTLAEFHGLKTSIAQQLIRFIEREIVIR